MDSRTNPEPEPTGTFVSGGADAGTPPSRPIWWLPVITAGVFGLVFSALLLTSSSRADLEPEATEAPRTTSLPRTSPCIACSLGHTCDGDTGQCVLIERSEVDCVKGASYDEEAGYCVAEVTPAPAPARTPRVTGRTGPTPAADPTPPPHIPPTAPPPATTPQPSTPAPTPAQ